MLWLGWGDNVRVYLSMPSGNSVSKCEFLNTMLTLAAGGDEDVQGSTPGPAETHERSQQSLAFDDELDDLQYLKMKEGPF